VKVNPPRPQGAGLLPSSTPARNRGSYSISGSVLRLRHSGGDDPQALVQNIDRGVHITVVGGAAGATRPDPIRKRQSGFVLAVVTRLR